jgi:hypothetical protein
MPVSVPYAVDILDVIKYYIIWYAPDAVYFLGSQCAFPDSCPHGLSREGEQFSILLYVKQALHI